MSLNNLNHVTATGYLARDPVLRDLPSGHQICEMHVASNNRWHNKLTGKWDEWTDYFNVRVFGAFAPIAHRCLHKGSGVAIDGRLTSEPARCSDPEHRSEVLILAEHMQFIENVSVNLGRRGEAEGEAGGEAIGGEAEGEAIGGAAGGAAIGGASKKFLFGARQDR
jgi:single-strand DNA-binding protein